MQTMFTYGGSRKSAVTPRTILYGNSPARGDRFRFGAYSTTYDYDSVGSVGGLPISPEAAAVMSDVNSLSSVAGVAERISAIDAAIATLTQFEKQTRAYYDRRVNQTSGGKRDRLRSERSDLCNQALSEIALLRSARASAVRRASSLATASQSDFNPDTGVALTPVEKQAVATQQAASGQGFNATSLILPVGAALAALFFLKGH